jgi:ZPR1 zinc-finger domain
MAFTCPNCGYKSNEVKGGGAVPPKGTVHTLTARTQSDFSRDVLKVLFELSAQLGCGSMYTLHLIVCCSDYC